MGRRVGWGTKSASEACPEVLETWKASCTGVGPLQGLADLKGSCPVVPLGLTIVFHTTYQQKIESQQQHHHKILIQVC